MTSVFNLRQLSRLFGFRRAARGPESADSIDWLRVLPFIAIHVACLAVFWVGWSPIAVWTAIGLYAIRVFALTGFYHRYFSHRSFRTSRALQFVFAVIGASAAQRGPLWWAAHHRHHHATSDSIDDPHSPVRRGFWYSHMAWFLTTRNFETREERIRDWLKYPELRFLDRYDGIVPLAMGAILFGVGAWVGAVFPATGVTGSQMLVWGLVSTVAVYHVTFMINSLAHRWGSRRYDTEDRSRNNPVLALLTFGEGWHNNHHHYPASVRQGFYWWEIDMTWYLLLLLEKLGLVWDLKSVPMKRRESWRHQVKEATT